MVKNGNMFWRKIIHKNLSKKMVKITKNVEMSGKVRGNVYLQFFMQSKRAAVQKTATFGSFLVSRDDVDRER